MSNGTSTDVSVVIPVWDRYVEQFLPEALESLRAQDTRAELIVVDNASTTPVPPLDGVRIVRASQRLTVGAARNLGLQAVTTPFVVFWDADDVMPPGTLNATRTRLRDAPDAVAVATAILERPGEPHHWPRPLTRPLSQRPTLFALVHAVSALFPTTGGVMIRTAPAREAGGFADADGGDDWVLGVSLAFRGRVLLDPHAGRIYRRWPGSLSSRWRPIPDLVAHSRAVRRGLRTDAGVPAWVRALSPALAPAHMLVIFALRPLRRLTRSVLARRAAGSVPAAGRR